VFSAELTAELSTINIFGIRRIPPIAVLYVEKKIQPSSAPIPFRVLILIWIVESTNVENAEVFIVILVAV
jgi:hypothetical protein